MENIYDIERQREAAKAKIVNSTPTNATSDASLNAATALEAASKAGQLDVQYDKLRSDAISKNNKAAVEVANKNAAADVNVANANRKAINADIAAKGQLDAQANIAKVNNLNNYLNFWEDRANKALLGRNAAAKSKLQTYNGMRAKAEYERIVSDYEKEYKSEHSKWLAEGKSEESWRDYWNNTGAKKYQSRLSSMQ